MIMSTNTAWPNLKNSLPAPIRRALHLSALAPALRFSRRGRRSSAIFKAITGQTPAEYMKEPPLGSQTSKNL